MASSIRLRNTVLVAREQVQTGLEEVRRLHDSGLASVQVCARISSVIDQVLLKLFEASLDSMPEDQGKKLRERVALVAVGGYGRRQQAPCSDVDLMILYAGAQDDAVRQFTQRLTQDLFDTGLKPGHSLRTVAEAVRLARSDTVICTSLIESRLVIGSLPLFEEFRRTFQQMVERRGTAFCREFIMARKEERHKFGETVYLLEPNIKRTPGGLRDIHLLRWLWFAKSGESDPNRLLQKGVISNFDHRRLMSAQSYLLHVRNEMHFGSNSGSDVLTRTEQKRIAEKFQIRDKGAMLPVELFMSDYFRHTSHVSFLTTRMCDLVSPPPVMSWVLEPMLSKALSAEFRMGTREISATQLGTTKLAKNLEDAIKLVDLARLYDKRIAQETWYHVYRSAPAYSMELTPLAVRRFREMLDSPLLLVEALRRMHELGILEKVLPDFTAARCLLQFNRYHKYTVDEHCIRSVGEATKLGERSDHAGHVYRKLTRKWLLHLVLLLHDLGKALPGDHSETGAEIARRIGPRLNLTDEETALAARLVQKHLWMTHAALWHDTSNADYVRQFASKIETPEELDMLYALSCADLAAVGPGVLNQWKVNVLGELHRRARALLTDTPDVEQLPRRKAARHAVWSQLKQQEQHDHWYEEMFRGLPESFVTTVAPETIAQALRSFATLEERQGIAFANYIAESKTVEFIAGVSQGVGRGIFSAMAGVLRSQGMSILAAETAALHDDILLLRFQATDTDHKDSKEPSAPERLEKLCKAMVKAIDSDEPPKFRRIWGQDAHNDAEELSTLKSEVRLNTDISEDSLIIEVFAFDRIGLLYELARAVHEMNLSIRFAKIGTHLDQVVDVFYVTERNGSKPAGHDRLHGIYLRMMEVIEAAPASK
ncbi:[protein-PII] uridylyltransferase [Aeoliella mucimassa]|uniref:Bifunctional uridylyltransferase/uridylyl-removing enzyme n=1 Tax=Aeoliella mucimassa TaxID=2527972 RepID=A0A518AII1_9BACT|nr:[protein-PII] uridylyltransferase [Aeoliella mucimassa]QDU54537.1 Bifunctional uridylyltransferase/uridylyl-removing enzyme [Aeoliella mucimassa]